MDSEAYYPMLADGEIGKKTYAMSALLSALMAQTDAENGDVPYVSPSNKPLQAVALVLKDGTEVVLDQGQANTVNSYGVVTAIAHGSIRRGATTRPLILRTATLRPLDSCAKNVFVGAKFARAYLLPKS